MNTLTLRAPALLIAALLNCTPAFAATDADTQEALEDAREELERAREELRRAAEQLAEVYADARRDAPGAEALRYFANPERGFLGVNIEEGPRHGEHQRGVLVTGVTPGSGADRAGLRSGDVLIAANGQSLVFKPSAAMDPMMRLKEVMNQTRVGTEVQVEIEREGKPRKLKVIAGRPPEDELAILSMPPFDMELPGKGGETDVLVFHVPSTPGAPGAPLPPGFPGSAPDLQLARLDADLAAYFRTDEGVLVVRAPSEGGTGLRSGDVIQEINGEDVESPVEVLERLTEAQPGSKLSIKVVRHGRSELLAGVAQDSVMRKIIRTRKLEIPTPPAPPAPP